MDRNIIEIKDAEDFEKCQLCGSSYFVSILVIGKLFSGLRETDSKRICFHCREELALELTKYNQVKTK